MSYKIIFELDPRNPQNEFLSGGNDYSRIEIQLVETGGLSANLQRREDDDFYELWLYDVEKNSFDDTMIFSETYDPKAVCDLVEQLFEDRHLEVHLREDDDTPLLIRAKRKPSIRF